MRERNIALLGSTGSIGRQTLELLDTCPGLKIISLCAGTNIDLLEKQIRKYKPLYAAMGSCELSKELEIRVSDTSTKVYAGMDGIIEAICADEADIVVTAIVGMIGIKPTIAAIESGKDIALANKETLVTAGHIIMPLIKEKGISLLPVDSEHSAIFQCLQSAGRKPAGLGKGAFPEIEEILLTASGGPFLGMTKKELKTKKAADALLHPNWNMGRKITIDSATMVNKGLEVMEACHLFGVTRKQVKVLIQPKSIIHSMVQFKDGAVIAQLGMPDMKLPILYALSYPDRLYMQGERLDFYKMKSIDFIEPDTVNFEALPLCYKAIDMSGNAPTVYNASNEKAVSLFLDGKIGFTEIYDIISDCLDNIEHINSPDVDEILYTEAQAHRFIESKYALR